MNWVIYAIICYLFVVGGIQFGMSLRRASPDLSNLVHDRRAGLFLVVIAGVLAVLAGAFL
jgi:Trk-type K+ transport system membrane component